MSIEAMKQAVEAFEAIKKYVTDDGAMPENWDAYHEEEYFALEALRQAIEQAEREPVAYKYTDKTNPLVFYFTTHKDSLPNPDVIETALYTAPSRKEWVGLTDEEIDAIGYKYGAGGLDLMDELSAMLKEKNNG